MSEFDSYVSTFRIEAEELLSEVEECVLIIEDNPNDMDTLNRLFRAMHTIKGSGSMFGFTAVASFTHHVETVLDKVRDGSIPVSRTLIDLILASRDQISRLMNSSEENSELDRQECQQIIDGLRELLDTDCSDHQEIDSSPSERKNVVSTYRIRFAPSSDIFASGNDPALLLDEIRELGECEVVAQTDNIPSLNDLNPEECFISWEIVLTTEKDENAIKDVFIFVEDSCKIEIQKIGDRSSISAESTLPRIGEILVDRGDATQQDVVEALSLQPKVGQLLVDTGVVSHDKVTAALLEQKALERQQVSAKNDTIRVPSDKLDKLVNLVGELVIVHAQLAQVASLTGAVELDTPVEEVGRLTADLRDIVLNIRMMPIGATFSRFRRLVRDMSMELGKQIDLVAEGAETEMDKTVIDRLGDPLVHIIRNCVDHGIELPDERVAAGKPRNGIIRLEATHTGASIVITIEDDGKGLDTDLIRRLAVEKGLIAEDAELSEQQVLYLIFVPGFSTAARVTNVSGRGVGMDVVKREIDALRGSVSVSSSRGKGTKIQLTLPLTLAIIEGLMVDVGAERYVVPLSEVEECLELTDDRYALSKGRNVIQVRGEPIPIVRLREVFGSQSEIPSLEETVVVRTAEGRFGIVVDRVIGHHQTVIKSLVNTYKDVASISGATILGDGTVALILDTAGLRTLADSEKSVTMYA